MSLSATNFLLVTKNMTRIIIVECMTFFLNSTFNDKIIHGKYYLSLRIYFLLLKIWWEYFFHFEKWELHLRPLDQQLKV